MQGMREDVLVVYTWCVRVGYLNDILRLICSYRSCYKRLFVKKKKNAEIELSSGDENDFEQRVYLSSGDEDDVIEVKPKLEEMEPCCSLSLKD
jgi:hypothetical protein